VSVVSDDDLGSSAAQCRRAETDHPTGERQIELAQLAAASGEPCDVRHAVRGAAEVERRTLDLRRLDDDAIGEGRGRDAVDREAGGRGTVRGEFRNARAAVGDADHEWPSESDEFVGARPEIDGGDSSGTEGGIKTAAGREGCDPDRGTVGAHSADPKVVDESHRTVEGIDRQRQHPVVAPGAGQPRRRLHDGSTVRSVPRNEPCLIDGADGVACHPGDLLHDGAAELGGHTQGGDGVGDGQHAGRALATCRFSIMRPLWVTTPLPSARPSSKAAMSPRACSTGLAGCPHLVGRSTWPGWMSVLPSKPISKPCTHSALEAHRGPSRRCNTPSRMTLPASRAASSAQARCGSSGWRPGTPSEERLGQVVGAHHQHGDPLSAAAIASHVEHGRGGLDHRPDLHVGRAPRPSRCPTPGEVGHRRDLGDDHRGGRRSRRRR
jgi:hypothetical protein